MKLSISLRSWKNIYTNEIFYSSLDPVIKQIDGVKFMEITSSTDRLDVQFARVDSLAKQDIKTVEIKTKE